jgi:RNA polymerase-binding protein DksA
MLTQQDLADIRQKLVEEKNHLEGELAKISRKNPDNPEDLEPQFEDYGADISDSSSEVAKFDLNITLEKTLEKSLSDVNKALERVEKGQYGVCKYCGEQIDPKRLLARPTSSACIPCKTKLKSL